jgi:hypothetical protein
MEVREYVSAINRHVCPVCVDAVYSEANQFVRCGLPAHVKCPLILHLPKVVQALRSVDSPRVEDYLVAVRREVCTACEHSHDGFCTLRLKGECALDTYLPLVLDEILGIEASREPSGATAPTDLPLCQPDWVRDIS